LKHGAGSFVISGLSGIDSASLNMGSKGSNQNMHFRVNSNKLLQINNLIRFQDGRDQNVWLFCHIRVFPVPAKLFNKERVGTIELSYKAETTAASGLIYEQTIRSSVECQGVGLHSGAPVHLRILPASAGAGIVFRRVDLDGFEIEATGRNVARVSYATSLMKKGVLISTTEHLLSALIGVGIDNAIIELDNLELPILDGSAKPFVDLIQKAGIRKQRRPRTYLRICREIELREGGKFIAVYPADSYSVSYSINFPHPLIGKETFSLELSNGNYLRELAAARTFGSREDEQAMRAMGLIRGASRDNCVVLTKDGIENPPLRYPDEFVRHKVLDLIGDLALLGKQILGNIVADRAGHAMHTALVSRLLRDKSLWEETTLQEEHEPAEIPVQHSAVPVL
jgi:UDP-3-O-[3-hydroxymyristoyl] N-acetylglucosamine deacetylase